MNKHNWKEWLRAALIRAVKTMAQTADIGLFAKSISPASISRFSLKSWITAGIGVCTGQPS